MAMNVFVSGMLTAGYLVAGLFFFKFHRKSTDRLFLFFGIAMWMLAIQRGLLTGVDPVSEAGVFLYGLRLAAFVVILAAIVDKNRRTA